MDQKINIAFLGGDRRQYCTATMLNKKAFNIGVWGLDYVENTRDDIHFFSDCEKMLENSACAVLPLPSSMDGKTLHTPLLNSGERKRLTSLLEYMKEGEVVIGGKIPAEFKDMAEKKGVKVYDYYESEPFQIENAYLTAEAALSIAMNQLNKSIRDSLFAVFGYGRIAKHLVRLLRVLGADVTVFARKESDLMWARSMGCRTERMEPQGENGLGDRILGFDVIYNTVPARILTAEALSAIGTGTFIIDLASVPGGVDICAAKELGSNVLWATSLPGKYAPESAGKLIAEWIEKTLAREGKE